MLMVVLLKKLKQLYELTNASHHGMDDVWMARSGNDFVPVFRFTLCASILATSVSVCLVCIWCPWKPGEGIMPLGLELQVDLSHREGAGGAPGRRAQESAQGTL